MIQILIRPDAESDIQEASDWYEEREVGLGGRFVGELGEVFQRICLMPLQFPNIGQDVRRALMRRFPYSIYFVLRSAGEARPTSPPDAVVIAVLHQRRRPSLWKKRLQTEAKQR